MDEEPLKLEIAGFLMVPAPPFQCTGRFLLNYLVSDIKEMMNL